MKQNSLIIPIQDYLPLAQGGHYTILPFYPTPDTICTIKSINGNQLTVEECTPIWCGINMCFDPAYWREIQAPEEVNVEELVEESNNYQLVEKTEYL